MVRKELLFRFSREYFYTFFLLVLFFTIIKSKRNHVHSGAGWDLHTESNGDVSTVSRKPSFLYRAANGEKGELRFILD